MTSFIINCLSVYYWIEVTSLALLPIGADIDASIYKVQASNQKTYFVKLKTGHSHNVNIEILNLLHQSGMCNLILPIKTAVGQQMQQVGDMTCIVYPFVQGQDGFSRSLSDEQWVVLGQALKHVHTVEVPSSLQSRIRHEDFSPKWRNAVRSLYAHIEAEPIGDEVAWNLWKFLRENKLMIEQLVDRCEQLSQKIDSQSLNPVLCHSDIHAGNVLIDDNDNLYIVDWDEPILAPKERDLMFIGAGVGNAWNNPHEESLFYQGYGPVKINRILLAYYRCERIIEDIALYSQELLFKPTEGKNRLEMYQQFMDMFSPNGVVDIAFKTDKHAS